MSGFRLRTDGGVEDFGGAELDGLSVSGGLFGRSLVVGGPVPRKFRGVRRSDARAISGWMARQRARAGVGEYVAAAHRFQLSFGDLLDAHQRRGLWISRDEVSAVLALRPVPGGLGPVRTRRGVLASLRPEEREAVDFVTVDHRQLVSVTNDAIVVDELRVRRDFFDRVEKSPLTAEQASAVATFDNRVRVIAAAGSGKTSVIVARAAYAIARDLVPPERILMLAFNADAAVELQERVTARLRALGLPHDGVRTSTFHSFGRALIGEATGRKPSVARWVEGGKDVDKISEIVDHLRDSSPQFRYQWDIFRLLYAKAPEDPDGGEPDSYDPAEQLTGFRTYRGDTVRSVGERMIADWLFLNGVDYVYEQPYVIDVADAGHSQYRPDFFYPPSTSGTSTGRYVPMGHLRPHSPATPNRWRGRSGPTARTAPP